MDVVARSRRLTTVLTIGVVLVAGSAAAFVNSQVLSRRTANASSRVPVSLVEQTTTTSLPGVEPTSSMILLTESTLSPTETRLQADAAGSVVVDTDGDRLMIVSVEPSEGYLVESMSHGLDPNNASVFFRAPDGLLYEFRVGLVGGVVRASITEVDDTFSTTPSSGTSGGPTVTTSGSGSVTSTTDDSDVTPTSEEQEEEEEEEEDDDDD